MVFDFQIQNLIAKATAGGGGINVYWEGTSGFGYNVTVENSLIKNNVASTSGAGISSYNLVPLVYLTISNTTITQNTLYPSGIRDIITDHNMMSSELSGCRRILLRRKPS